MRLAWVELHDFRNHEDTRLDVPPGLVAAVGENGEGKTNLLEGMYFLFSLGSPRTSSDLPLVRAGAQSGFVRGEVETSSGRVLIEVEVRAAGANRTTLNRSPIRRRRDLQRRVRGVFSGPDDIGIIQGDPGERRRFMDEAVVAAWPPRESARTAYERVLRQRNRLLKEWGRPGAPADLEAWDAQLASQGTALARDRAAAVERIRGGASDAFRALAGGDGLEVSYRPSVEPGEGDVDRFLEALAGRRDDELARRTTLVGPHRDDLHLAVRDLQARGFASHGEAWAAALCLRLAVAGAVAEEIGEAPVTFLDDPFSGLDPTRRERLAAELAAYGQVVISVPDPAQVPADAAVWEVRGGRVRAA